MEQWRFEKDIEMLNEVDTKYNCYTYYQKNKTYIDLFKQVSNCLPEEAIKKIKDQFPNITIEYYLKNDKHLEIAFVFKKDVEETVIFYCNHYIEGFNEWVSWDLSLFLNEGEIDEYIPYSCFCRDVEEESIEFNEIL